MLLKNSLQVDDEHLIDAKPPNAEKGDHSNWKICKIIHIMDGFIFFWIIIFYKSLILLIVHLVIKYYHDYFCLISYMMVVHDYRRHHELLNY